MSRQRATPRELDVTINALNAEGLGVADLDGKPLHVRNGLPGETVTARILKRRKGVRYADAVDVVHPNVGRRGPACAYFPRCGGCNMHHMDYARQLQHKQQQLQDALALHEVRPVSWAPPRSAVRLGYRRKARLGVRLVGDQVLVGFRESFSNRVAKLSHCVVLTPALSALISPLKQLLSQFSIAGQIPQIELAQGDVQIAMLVRHLAPFTAQDMTLWRQFARQHDVEVLLQSGGYDTLVGLDGEAPARLGYSLLHQGLHLQFFPHQFTQVNHQINQMLIDDCLSYLKKLSGKRVFDLFCGIGNFSLPLARAGAQVTGLEVAADAVVQAEHNAARNRLANGVQFATADLYGTDADLPGPCDVLVLDPPRNGAGPNLASWVQKSGGTEMVYVSCNPASFAVDAALLARCGFRLQRVGIYDMFPHTAHVETMGYFVRQD